MSHPQKQAEQQQGEEIRGPVDHGDIVGRLHALAKAESARPARNADAPGAPLLPPRGSTPRNGPRSGGWRREGWGEIVRPFGAVRPAPAGGVVSKRAQCRCWL